jgi:type IV secretory pathway TrbL component
MISIFVVIVVLGLLLWAVNYAVPMEPMFKRILTAVAVVCLVLYLLKAFGLLNGHFIIPK